jgi:hypothetical protein
MMYAEEDFEGLPEPTGPFSVGFKRLFNVNDQHTLVFYPIKKRTYKSEEKPDYLLFKKGEPIGDAEMMYLFGNGMNFDDKPEVSSLTIDHRFDITKMNVAAKAQFDID